MLKGEIKVIEHELFMLMTDSFEIDGVHYATAVQYDADWPITPLKAICWRED